MVQFPAFQIGEHFGWRILYDGDPERLEMVAMLADNHRLQVVRVLKDTSRSLVLCSRFQDRDVVLKCPREKNRRKWIRFTTLYRRGEAFNQFLDMAMLIRAGIEIPQPLFAAEKRHRGMVTDSWLGYAYQEGETCGPAQYRAVVAHLGQYHRSGRLHGDAHIHNFLHRGGAIFSLDPKPRRKTAGIFSEAMEYHFLARSAPGIERYFPLSTSSTPYRVARMVSAARHGWKAVKRNVRKAGRRIGIGFRKQTP